MPLAAFPMAAITRLVKRTPYFPCAARRFLSHAPPQKERNVQWVFLGCPGVGKGTYASRLCNLLGVPHIATGDLVRSELASNGPLSSQVSLSLSLSLGISKPFYRFRWLCISDVDLLCHALWNVNLMRSCEMILRVYGFVGYNPSSDVVMWPCGTRLSILLKTNSMQSIGWIGDPKVVAYPLSVMFLRNIRLLEWFQSLICKSCFEWISVSFFGF